MNIATRLDRLAAEQQDAAMSGRPGTIIGAPWPTTSPGCVVVPGAMKAACGTCGADVALSPATGLKMHRLYPDVPILCFACYLARDQEASAPC